MSVLPLPTLELFVENNQKLLDPQISVEEKCQIVMNLRKYSAVEGNPPNKLMITAGLLPTLMNDSLAYSNDNLINILWIITNIASGDTQDLIQLNQVGGIEYFFKYALHHSPDISSQALWGLSNIAGESAQYRDMLIEKGIVDITVKHLNGDWVIGIQGIRIVSWLFNNLCRFKPSVQLHKIKKLLPYLRAMLYLNDLETNSNILWALSHVSEISDSAMYSLLKIEPKTLDNLKVEFQSTNQELTVNEDEEINDSMETDTTEGDDLILVLISFLENQDLSCVTPAMRTLSNFATGDDVLTDKVVKLGVVPKVVSLMAHTKKALRKEACFFLSNIAAGTYEQCQTMLACEDILPKVNNILTVDEESVRVEASYLVSNLLVKKSEIFNSLLLMKGSLGAMCESLLKSLIAGGSNLKIVQVGSEFLKEFLDFYSLKLSDNNIIDNIAYILKKILPIIEEIYHKILDHPNANGTILGHMTSVEEHLQFFKDQGFFNNDMIDEEKAQQDDKTLNFQYLSIED